MLNVLQQVKRQQKHFYYNAYFKNKEGKHKASNTSVQKLAKDFSGYKYYSAKGLVLNG